MLANLAASLVKNGSVRTTDAKAKEVKPFVERMVTFAKRGDLHAPVSFCRGFATRGGEKALRRDRTEIQNRFGDIRGAQLGFRIGDTRRFPH